MCRRLLSVVTAFCLLLLCCDLGDAQIAGWSNPSYSALRGRSYSVSFDSRSLIIDGQRALLFAGSTHYPRSTPDMWPDMFRLYREAGLNTLQMIIFWNYHEGERGRFDFQTESRNVLQFIQAAADAGLFIYLRLGPYICAEYTWGGMPYWLRLNGGVEVRSLDPKWVTEANRWLDFITAKVEPFLARNGGPIIIYQLENEYGDVEAAYGSEGPQFVQWNANKSVELDLGIPMAMCSQMDAPQFIISAYNGWYGDDWIPTFHAAYPNQPPMWTELWQGWFQSWTEATPTRPVEDIAFASLRWYIRGGAYVSYYPMIGGTTFNRQTGQVELKTDYDFDAPIDPYGVPHPRKYPHIQRLHATLQRYANLIVNSPAAADVVLPNDCRLNEYNSSTGTGSVAFLTNANSGSGKDQNITWRGRVWPVTAWSTQVIDIDTMTVVFDTSKVINAIRTRIAPEVSAKAADGDIGWRRDEAGIWSPKDAVVSKQLLEQLTLTFDHTDYLWYVTTVTLSQQQIDSGSVTLSITNANDYTYYFIGGELLARTQHTAAANVSLDVSKLGAGDHELQLLNANNGVDDFGAFLENVKRGLLGTIHLDGVDISNQTWKHQVGLKGERGRYYAADNPGSEWQSDLAAGQQQSLVWWRWNITTPTPHRPTGGARRPTWQIDVRQLSKGMMFVNGRSIGRFYNQTSSPDSCTACDPQSYFSGPELCRVGCGEITQPYLHVPAAYLSPPGQVNVIVAFAEQSIEPNSLKLRQRN